ncbi:response regulator [Aquibium carbonis]|uniref:histidine kinase n=1 Tax=Aquibium carbonis TaxID=2495581 RepID=A0A3S0A2B3_9HYPH|nr:ATP-binding protein [Aquibium carbonis]RST87196.1 response regulator [Aquibium carbonis]
MKADFAASREAVRRAGRTTRYLIALSVGLTLALACAFLYLSARQNSLQDSIREDALWAVYQLDREARTLSERLHAISETSDAQTLKGLATRYDILYSRLAILDNGQYQPHFVSSERINRRREQVRETVLGIEPAFNDVAAGKSLTTSALMALRAELPELLQHTNDLLTSTNAAVSTARAEARGFVMRMQNIAAAFVVALMLTIGLLILNLKRQLSVMRKASDYLERMTEQLSESYEAAEAGNRAKSQFMATIGHEIRTPLNAILGMAELMSNTRLSAENRENVRVITSSGTALLEVINEILDFAKLEHGEQLAEILPFDARALVKDSLRIMEGRAREQGDTLSCSCGIEGESWYYGDPTQLRRVVLNLVSNAVKFTENGSIHVKVSDAADSDGRPRLRFEVSDTGIGIPNEAICRLFNAFSQVDGTISRRYGGTGLGLAICKRIVESLGGEIGVDSEPGRGSLFWFEVPAERAPAQVLDVVQPVDTAQPTRLDVLLVEDNEVNRQVATRFLENLGQTVSIAVDGAEAVAMAKAHVYDLILMDMHMPVMDGIAATREIRRLDGAAGKVPIVAMTANASDTDRNLCIEVGMNGFEAKPISSARLRSLLARHGGKDTAGVDATAAGPSGDQAGDDAGTPGALSRDEGRYAELVDAIGQDGFDQLLGVFFDDASTLLSDLHRAMQSGDLELLDRSLHSLKGSASNLGFTGIASLADTLRSTRLDEAALAGMAAEIARLNDSQSRRAA